LVSYDVFGCGAVFLILFFHHKIRLRKLKENGVSYDAKIFEVDGPILGRFLSGYQWVGGVTVQYVDGSGLRHIVKVKRLVIRGSDRENEMRAVVYVDPAKSSRHEVEVFRKFY